MVSIKNVFEQKLFVTLNVKKAIAMNCTLEALANSMQWVLNKY